VSVEESGKDAMSFTTTLRNALFGIAILFCGLGRPLLAVRIEEVPTGMSAPWGIGFSRTFTTYVVGGSKFADNVVEEVDQVVWPDFGAIDLRELAVSPEGTVWIVEPSASRIWRVKQNPGGSTPFAIPGTPFSIVLGPDGNMWFTEYSGNKIGRITPSGTIWESALIPTADSHPVGITLASDGNLWFVEQSGNKLGKITPGGTITEYPLPTAGASPTGIASSAYGVLAITEPGVNKIAFASTTNPSPAYEVSIPTASSLPHGIAYGSDGAFWFVEYGTSKIGRTAGFGDAITEFLIPTGASHPQQIVPGPNGDLWFTEQATGKMGHVVLHSSGDPNGDGKVDVNDVFYLINYLFAGGAPPK
jgi:streptogramin lyase